MTSAPQRRGYPGWGIASTGRRRAMGTRTDRGRTDSPNTHRAGPPTTKTNIKRDRIMKTMKNKKLLGAGLVVMMAASLLATARAGESMKPMKGAEMLMMKPINTEAQAEALKPGDSIAMA